jgi:predicted transcriptional regulator
MPATLEKPRAVNVTVKLDDSERSSLKSLALAKQRTPHFLIKRPLRVTSKTKKQSKPPSLLQRHR